VAGEAGLAGLEAERARLYAELSGVGDFRRGTLSALFRKCGKANCRCAQPGARGTARSGTRPGGLAARR
jgi:hypothetical protein